MIVPSVVRGRAREAPALSEDDLDMRHHVVGEKEVGERGVELRPVTLRDLGPRRFECPFGAVLPTMRHDVEAVRDRDNPRGQRNVQTPKLVRIAAPVPSLVMREHAGRQLGVKRGKGRQHVGTARWMGRDRASFLRRELPGIVQQIIERPVNLADVVKECDSLHAQLLAIVESGGIGQDERVPGHAADMGAGFGVIHVDGEQDRLQQRRGEPLGVAAEPALPDYPESAERRSEREFGWREARTHDYTAGKN